MESLQATVTRESLSSAFEDIIEQLSARTPKLNMQIALVREFVSQCPDEVTLTIPLTATLFR
jgi:hypothetical protein